MSTLHFVISRAPFDLHFDCTAATPLSYTAAANHRKQLHSYRLGFPRETWLKLTSKASIAPVVCPCSASPINEIGLEQTQVVVVVEDEEEEEEEVVSFPQVDKEEYGQRRSASGFLCVSHGWGALLVNHNDLEMLRRFAQLQAEVFHTPTPFLNDFFFYIFKAEVLSSILYKIRNAGPNRFACLAAVPDSAEGGGGKIVGAVDAAAMADANVLRCFPGTSEYLYISGMAVDNAYRRQKVATVLLEACDLIASEWGFEFLVLQAYEDDKAARLLYARNGYKIISIDPWWLSKWFGKRRRVVLAKSASRCIIE